MTTSRGYVYLRQQAEPGKTEKIIVCNHTSEQIMEEFNILVDHGVTVKDVKIEHPVYGELTNPLWIPTAIK